jgi:hypothetical protein
MAKPDKKVEKKTEKKAASTVKAESKPKVSKKALHSKKLVAAIPSAKHGAPISSSEILARVRVHFYYHFFYAYKSYICA